MRCARLPAAASTSGCWKPGVVACTATSHGRRRGELAPGQDYGYVDNGAINLSLVHVSNSLLSVGLVVVENIGSASVGAVCSIDRQIKVFDRTKLAEDLLKMSLVDVLGQALDDNLGASDNRALAASAAAAATFAAVSAVASQGWRLGTRRRTRIVVPAANWRT